MEPGGGKQKAAGAFTCSLAKRAGVGHTQGVKQRVFIFWLVFVSATVLFGAPITFDSLKAGSQTYYHVTVLGVSMTDLYIAHNSGIINVKLKYLDPELQKRFEYDPEAGARAEKQQIKADAAFRDSVVQALKERAEKAQQKAAEETAFEEATPSDPISDSSLLDKPAPALEVEKWLGEKQPALEGKFVLVDFWTTWSAASRKYIPQFNTWQNQYTNQLVIVGLSQQPEEDVAKFSDPKIEFPCAIDTKGRMAKAAGATSVPYVLLIDPKGIVRYQGHPAALDENWLQSLFQQTAAE